MSPARSETSPSQLVFHLFGALAEFERNLIKERTLAGLLAARARGKIGGRPGLETSSRTVAMAKKLYADKTTTIGDICKTLNISRATLYRYINAGDGQTKKACVCSGDNATSRTAIRPFSNSP